MRMVRPSLSKSAPQLVSFNRVLKKQAKKKNADVRSTSSLASLRSAMRKQTRKSPETELVQLERQADKIQQAIKNRTSHLQQLQRQVEDYDTRIKQQRETLGQYTAVYHADDEHPAHGRPPLGRAIASTQNNQKIERIKTSLWNQYDRLLSSISTKETENSLLRDHIDRLRQQRIVHQRVFEKMETELSRAKNGCHSEQTALKSDYQARDSAQIQIMNTTKDFEIQRQHMKDVLKEFHDTMRAEEMNSASPRATPKQGKKKGGPMKLKVRLSNLNIGAEGGTANKMHDMAFYSDMWKSISERTKVDDVDQLVMSFLQIEQQNMQKVKQANSYMEQIKKLRDEERQMEEERTAINKLNDDDMAKRHVLIRTLEERAVEREKLTTAYDAVITRRIAQLQSFVAPLEAINTATQQKGISVKLAKYLQQPLIWMAQKHQSSDLSKPEHIVKFLSQVEAKVSALCQVYTAFQRRIGIEVPKNRGAIMGPETEHGAVRRELQKWMLNIPGQAEPIAAEGDDDIGAADDHSHSIAFHRRQIPKKNYKVAL